MIPWLSEAVLLARYVKESPRLSLMLTRKSKQAKKVVSYAESDDEDDEDAFDPAGINTQKRKLQRKSKVVESEDDDEDVFVGGLDGAEDDDDGMDLSSFICTTTDALQKKWTTLL